jgi:superfamily I DNA/RNA helicase
LEERRLFYVGMTRAKRFLYLSHAGKRRLMGRTLQLSPTSFLNPIREELVQRTRSGYAESRPRRDEQMGLFS